MPEYLSGDENFPDSSRITFDLTIEQFLYIQTRNLTMDQIYLLDYFSRNEISPQSIRPLKTQSIIQGLVRKGLMTPEGTVTSIGMSFLYKVKLERVDMPIPEPKQRVELDFDIWWKAYPTTDVFEYKGKTFKGTRGLRAKKEDCRRVYNKIINEREYTSVDLLRALNYEINLKMESSIRESENKMKYMQNSYTYLISRNFENFIEISKQRTLPEASQGGSIDI